MSARNGSSRTAPGRTDEAVEVGVPFDLLLSRATEGSWRNLVPAPKSTLALAGALVRRPQNVVGRSRALTSELAKVVAGRSELSPHPKDARYAHPAWSDNPILRRAVQAHLALSASAEKLVAEARLDESSEHRVTLTVGNLLDATAPSNNLLLNPAALRTAVDTRGASLVRGARHLARDLSSPPRVPRMVEPDAFEVGVTVAATPGGVVDRTAVYELVQYTATTPTVRQIPLLLVPPVINKFYVGDMAPGRSLIEFLVAQGHQVFVMSWRNPDVRHSAWNLDTYGDAIDGALDTVRRICRSESASMLSFCSGGILSAMVLAHLADTGRLAKVSSAAWSVTVLDQSRSGVAGALLTPAAAEAAARSSAAQGYLDGRVLAEVFAWLRPRDLIWNYWVDSYLMGKSPRPFDVLFWNADTTRMAAALHKDFLDMAQSNSLVHPGQARMLGSPVDLGKVDIDTYITGGINDHLCPWESTYASTQLLGGNSRFVLSSAGHVASIVNPPSNPKATFRIADSTPADAHDWLKAAETVKGSWWPDYSAWLHERGGDLVEAPVGPGGAEYPVIAAAPGTYVLAT
ncbi:alpha/beta fold hydrolase [Sporichthya sp.]|uniref:PHA/PHB synthase family protein n=1 Tax=Sporichthya sp. TaxID=65475 RepID=UPI0017CF0A65|nr:alpha/beta fold hydrolase [Sporichthya sp.]MBA3745280.1 alpha/beta fold hydrolase [Sporichthya sp.]